MISQSVIFQQGVQNWVTVLAQHVFARQGRGLFLVSWHNPDAGLWHLILVLWIKNLLWKSLVTLYADPFHSGRLRPRAYGQVNWVFFLLPESLFLMSIHLWALMVWPYANNNSCELSHNIFWYNFFDGKMSYCGGSTMLVMAKCPFPHTYYFVEKSFSA